MGKGDVVVGDLVEEMDLLLFQEDASGNRVHRRITPALVEKAAVLVQRLEVVNVLLGPQPLQTSNLKVGPLSDTWLASAKGLRKGGDGRREIAHTK